MVQKILTIPAEDETILRNLEDDDEVNCPSLNQNLCVFSDL